MEAQKEFYEDLQKGYAEFRKMVVADAEVAQATRSGNEEIPEGELRPEDFPILVEPKNYKELPK